MTDYHTLNIAKKFYNRIEKYREKETVFDNTKAFILHGVTLAMQKNNTMENTGLKALEILKEDKDNITEEDISNALNKAVQDKMNDLQ